MISFIIIGRNEGWKLVECVKSIYKAVDFNNIQQYEIIYVDSNSEDDSILRIKDYEKLEIYKLINMFNPAIARNFGKSKSKGSVLCFLDGDMLLNENFFKMAFKNQCLIHPLIGGRVIDRVINKNGEVLEESMHHVRPESYFKLITGGAFIVERSTWDKVEGMDNRFVKGADPELGIRLAEIGVLLLNLPELFIIHQNDKYLFKNGREITLNSFSKNVLYSSMLTYRKNIFSKHTWARIASHEKTLISLVLSLLFIIISKDMIWISLYFIVVFIRSVKTNSLIKFVKRYIFFIWRDIFVLIAFCFFYPKKIELTEIVYKKYS